MFSGGVFQHYNPGAISGVKIMNEYENVSYLDLTNATDITSTAQTKLTEQGTKSLTAADVILTGGWTALISIISLPDTVIQIFEKIGSSGIDFIPLWFVALVIGAVTIFVVWRVIGISTRTESGGV